MKLYQAFLFIATHVDYASTNKTRIVSIDTQRFLFLPAADAPHVYARARTLCCFHSLISIRTFRKALTASVDSCAVIKECPFSGVFTGSQARSKDQEILEEGGGAGDDE